MFDVRVNLERNRLYTVVRGRLSDADAKALNERVVREVQQLKPGFGVVSDITEMEELSDFAVAELERCSMEVEKRGRGRIVRVVGRAMGVALQFERMGKKLGYDANLAYSVEEADQVLDRQVPTEGEGGGSAPER